MTDYRLRNYNLLHAERDTRVLTWLNVVVFGAIAVTVTIGVDGHLSDRFNTTAAGFAPASAGVARTACGGAPARRASRDAGELAVRLLKLTPFLVRAWSTTARGRRRP